MKWENSSDILSVVSGRSCFYLRVKGVLPSDAVRKNDNWRVLCHRKPRPLRFAYVILENLKARICLHLISRFQARDSAPLYEGKSCRDHDRPSPPGRTVFVYSRKIQETI